MPDELIYCPACNHKLRVPESLLGQLVQCPECQTSFTAPVRVGDTLTPPAVVPAMRPAPEEEAAPRPPASESRTFVPGLFLLLVGLASLVVNGSYVLRIVKDPEGFEQQTRQQIDQMSEQFKLPAEFRAQAPEMARRMKTLYPVFFGVSVIICAGAASMLTMRFRWLAILGCVLAMINISNACCLIGLPAGIWSLVTVLNPDVKAQFR